MGVSIQILPCPFCGASAEVSEQYGQALNNKVVYVVRCTNRTCPGRNQKPYRNLDKAVALWNRRNNYGRSDN